MRRRCYRRWCWRRTLIGHTGLCHRHTIDLYRRKLARPTEDE